MKLVQGYPRFRVSRVRRSDFGLSVACVVAVTAALSSVTASAATDTWTTVKPMPTARLGLAATTGLDGRIYALGGESSNLSTPTAAEVYTPSTDTWQTLPPMPSRSHLAAATGLDGSIYAIGGAADGCCITNAVEIYSPITNTWRQGPALPFLSSAASLAAVTGPDGRIYAMGGYNDNGGYNPLQNVNVYDPASMTWTAAASMPTAHVRFGAALGPDGRIYVVGGSGYACVLCGGNVVEVYTPSTDSWTTLQPVPIARRNHAVAAGPDGRIYAIGGDVYAGSGAMSSVEAYTPSSNTWESVAPLTTPLTDLAASSSCPMVPVPCAPGNHIYAFGGGPDNYTGAVSSIAQRYDGGVPTAVVPEAPTPVLLVFGAVAVLGSSVFATRLRARKCVSEF